jgi:hypothetical protein
MQPTSVHREWSLRRCPGSKLGRGALDHWAGLDRDTAADQRPRQKIRGDARAGAGHGPGALGETCANRTLPGLVPYAWPPTICMGVAKSGLTPRADARVHPVLAWCPRAAPSRSAGAAAGRASVAIGSPAWQHAQDPHDPAAIYHIESDRSSPT